MQRKFLSLLLFTALIAVMVVGVAGGVHQALAEEGTNPQPTPSPMHPAYALLDADGNPVAETGQPADLVKTCGECHDTAFITTHATHQMAEDIPGFEGMTASCYLCHSTNPNGEARKDALAAGETAWADTAVLLGSGLVEKGADGWQWNPAAFDEEGKLKPGFVDIHAPTNANCAQCHGVVHTDMDTPLVVEDLEANWVTLTTGQVVSPQRISDSGMNIAGKEALTYAWDVHAERGVQCVDCHHSTSSPAARRYDELPAYLTYDPRHPDTGEYLKQPSHVLTSERCEACHDPQAAHKDWLPYLDLHMANVACETCHTPQMYAPAAKTFDYTVILPDGSTRTVYRGITPSAEAAPGAEVHEPFTVSHEVVGFQPVLLKNAEGKLAPYNLVTTFKWVYEKDGKTYPVSTADLREAWMPGGKYAADIVAAFDANGDGALSADEIVLDSQDKVDLIAKHLADLGLSNPRIVGKTEPFAIHHSVAQSNFAVQDCRACHSENSRIGKPMALASAAPAGVDVSFDSEGLTGGGQIVAEGNVLTFQPDNDMHTYVAGYDRARWVDILGVLMLIGVVLGVAFHGGLRVYFGRKFHPRHHHVGSRWAYLYTGAERFWHWLQMVSIVGLLLTGLVIHNPDKFGNFAFQGMVFVHTVLGWIFGINFLFALYYHLTTGYIKQYLPRPRGLRDRILLQIKFYGQGIFRGEPHPFKKTFSDKLNPMQRMAYFILLFVMLPLQMITGGWLWVVRVWPQAATWLGDMTMTRVATLHTLVAWMIGVFVVIHVYLTTTGHTFWSYISAMITGWEEVEVDDENEPMAV